MKQDLQAIIDLMEELKGKMGEGPEDFSERLGKSKPGLEVVKIGVDAKPGMEAMHDEPDMDDKGGMPDSDEDDSGLMAGLEDDESPEEKLKNRLLKLRG
jgi:hypothetical protein